MRLHDLFEAISPSKEIIDYYMKEGCGIFAYALWLAYDKPENGRIGIISAVAGEKWSRSIPFEVTHAFFLIENSGNGIDVKGIEPIWRIAKPFGNAQFHSQYHPGDFRTVYGQFRSKAALRRSIRNSRSR